MITVIVFINYIILGFIYVRRITGKQMTLVCPSPAIGAVRCDKLIMYQVTESVNTTVSARNNAVSTHYYNYVYVELIKVCLLFCQHNNYIKHD